MEESLLISRLTVRQHLHASATVVLEILTVFLGSFLVVVFFLTLSISEQETVKVPNLEEKILTSRLSVSQNLDALATVVLEILTVYLGLLLGDFLTISEQ